MSSTILNEFSHLYDVMIKDLTKRINEVEAKEEAWKKMEKKMEETSSKVGSKVVFDVGGTKFAISKSTLLNHPDTYFSSLLRSDNFKVVCIFVIYYNYYSLIQMDHISLIGIPLTLESFWIS